MSIAILFGAVSYEHEISIVSAISMKNVIKGELVYIFCDKDREFYMIDSKIIKSSLFSSGKYKKEPRLMIKNGGFFQKTLMGSKKIEFDVLLNLSHGADGEDGKLAGMLEFFNIAFIGPRMEACVVSFNKLFTKHYANEHGVKTLDYQTITRENQEITIEYPFILKPLRLGSSIGVSIVKSESELDYALDVAFEFDDTILVEPYIKDVLEYNVAGIKADDFKLSIVEEPKKEEFLDFDKKYLDFSRTNKIEEAKISKELKTDLQNSFKKIYNTTFEGSLIRCDFFVIKDEVYLNEINPIPGSMSNYLFENFNKTIKTLAKHLKTSNKIPITYEYLHSIAKAKGK